MKSDERSSLGWRIKEARTRAGLSQSEIGDVCNVKGPTVSRWEQDQGKGPGAVQIAAIAKATNRSISFFSDDQLPVTDQTAEDLLEKLRQKNLEIKEIKSTYEIIPDDFLSKVTMVNEEKRESLWEILTAGVEGVLEKQQNKTNSSSTAS